MLGLATIVDTPVSMVTKHGLSPTKLCDYARVGPFRYDSTWWWDLNVYAGISTFSRASSHLLNVVHSLLPASLLFSTTNRTSPVPMCLRGLSPRFQWRSSSSESLPSGFPKIRHTGRQRSTGVVVGKRHAQKVPELACWSMEGLTAAKSTASISRAWLRASLSVLLAPKSSCHLGTLPLTLLGNAWSACLLCSLG
jgi:hypothetical protein